MSDLRTSLPKIVTTLPGPKTAALKEERLEFIPRSVLNPYPLSMKRSAGAMFEDLDGNTFIDFVGGVGVLNIGHCHPEVVDAVKEQAELNFHAQMNCYSYDTFVGLAKKLSELAPVKKGEMGNQTFFANSGTEANENAVKIARCYTGRPNVICFSGAFHGRSNLTMAMSAKKVYAKNGGPLPPVYRADFPYLYRKPAGMTDEEAIQYFISQITEGIFSEGTLPQDTAAIVIEPVIGEGGFMPVPFEYAKALREICDQHGILLICDEVQTGFCRTGKMFASDYWAEGGFAPDIISAAKSIGAGLPLSAVMARKEIYDAVPDSVIGGTTGGNNIACAAALKSIEVMERDNLADRANEIGDVVMSRYKKLFEKYEAIGDIRALGGMVGLEFVKDRTTKEPDAKLAHDVSMECLNRGLFFKSCGIYNNGLRFLAPLVITDEQLNCGLDIFESVLEDLLSK